MGQPNNEHSKSSPLNFEYLPEVSHLRRKQPPNFLREELITLLSLRPSHTPHLPRAHPTKRSIIIS